MKFISYIAAVTIGWTVVSLASLAHDAPAPFIKFETELGTVVGKEGSFRISLLAFYIDDKLNPEFQLNFEEGQASVLLDDGASYSQTSYLYSYENIDEFVGALESSLRSLNDKKNSSIAFKLCKLQCAGVRQSSIRVDPRQGSIRVQIAQTSSSNYAVTLDGESSSTLLNALKYAISLKRYLDPQFKAFNAQKPDKSTGLVLEGKP